VSGKSTVSATSAARAAVARYRGILVRESAALLPATAPVAAPFAPRSRSNPPPPPPRARWMRTLGGPHSPSDCATDFFSVEAGNSFRCFRIVGHFHKCESGARPFHGPSQCGHAKFARMVQTARANPPRRLKLMLPTNRFFMFFLPLSISKIQCAARAVNRPDSKSLGGDDEDRMKSRGACSGRHLEGYRRCPVPFGCILTIPEVRCISVWIMPQAGGAVFCAI